MEAELYELVNAQNREIARLKREKAALEVENARLKECGDIRDVYPRPGSITNVRSEERYFK